MKKGIRFLAAAVSFVMIAGMFSGCSKTSGKIKKLAQDSGAVIYDDYDKLNRAVKHLSEDEKYEFFDTGIYYGASGSALNETLQLEDYDGPELDSVEMFFKTENLETLAEKKGVSGFGLGFAMAVTYKDKIEAVKAFRHIYYGFDDALMHATENNIDDLSTDEASFSKDKAKGHIVINIDLSNIETKALEDYKSLDDINASVKLDGKTLVFTVSVGDSFVEGIDSISSSADGIAPSKVTSSDAIDESVQKVFERVDKVVYWSPLDMFSIDGFDWESVIVDMSGDDYSNSIFPSFGSGDSGDMDFSFGGIGSGDDIESLEEFFNDFFGEDYEEMTMEEFLNTLVDSFSDDYYFDDFGFGDLGDLNNLPEFEETEDEETED